MTLIDLGHFGPRDATDPSNLKKLLQLAFESFKTWRKINGIPCSQKRFTPNLVIKAVHGHYMTAKAYSGRVILEWLATVSRDASSSGNYNDPRLPLQATALRLG